MLDQFMHSIKTNHITANFAVAAEKHICAAMHSPPASACLVADLSLMSFGAAVYCCYVVECVLLRVSALRFFSAAAFDSNVTQSMPYGCRIM